MAEFFKSVLVGDSLNPEAFSEVYNVNDKLLTPREREVIELIASGLQNKDIADRLGLRIRTVESHVRSI